MPRRKRPGAKPDPQTPHATTAVPQPPYRPPSRGRAVVFRLLAAVSPLILLGATNLILYWCDVGWDTRVVIPVTSAGDATTFCFNDQASLAYYDDRDLAGPDVRPFQLPRPDRTYRIVVVGESSVAGFPYYAELAFPRHVEIFLRPQMPDRHVEVLNAGIVGVNSFALVDFVPRMLACQPDLVVVYMGHNEFYGPGGVGSTATLAPSLYPAQTFLRRWRFYQALNQLFQTDEPQQALVARLPKDLEIPWDGPMVQAAEQHFRRHLAQMAQAIERQNIPVLFCSVASNLSDQSPVRSVSDPRLTEQQIAERDAQLQAGEEKLRGGDHAAALQCLDKAAAIDAGYARIVYRQAECRAAAGQRDLALESYRRARDLDGCRFRAPSSFREIIREVATDAHRTRCYFLDLDNVLANLSQRAAPGNDFFLEHVHFNFDGHREVAHAIARAIVEQVEGRAWNAEVVPTRQDVERATGITTFDHLLALGHVLMIVHEQPFGSAPDEQRQYGYLSAQLQDCERTLPDADKVKFFELGAEMRRRDMMNGMAARVLASGEIQRALDLFRTAQLRRPWEITSYIGAAKCLAALGNREEARAQIDQALQLAPRDPDLLEIHADLNR